MALTVMCTVMPVLDGATTNSHTSIVCNLLANTLVLYTLYKIICIKIDSHEVIRIKYSCESQCDLIYFLHPT